MNGQVKTWTFVENILGGTRFSKIIKVLKPESVVSENAGHHHTHIYISYNIGVFKFILSIHSFYISCQLSLSKMTSMVMSAIIKGIRMASNHRKYRWVKTHENDLVLKMNLHIKMLKCYLCAYHH